MIPETATSSLLPDGHRKFVYPADVKGRFAVARRWTFAVLIAVYVALPWIPIGGHPAVFIDIPRRHFHLFGATFNAQDIWMMLVVLLGFGFILLVATALLGRVWCGWACPQTVFLDGVYRRVERWLQGPRDKRMRRDAGEWTWDRVWRKSATHVAWIGISFVLAHVFLSYFTSLPGLFQMVQQAPGSHPEAFAVAAAVTAGLYLNFAFFREQLCIGVCPYGRLQSVLIDQDSLVIGYDTARGEPRGKLGHEGAGDCVDCKRCVVVCPTGIDIRNGLQLDCIACTACIDACDEIMVRIGRKPGLVRYDSLNGLQAKTKRVLRPRLYLYFGIFGAAIVAATFALAARRDFEANLLRTRGLPFVVDAEKVTNSFEIHIVNKKAESATFTVAPQPSEGMTFIVPMAEITLAPMADAHAPVFMTVPRAQFHGERRVPIRVSTPGEERVLEARFLGPSR